jgi:LuxR family transcriptional regulator, maltose regulon positive regulatory protein
VSPRMTVRSTSTGAPARLLADPVPVTHLPPLVQSKLAPPALSAETVLRQRVLDLVEDHLDRRIVSLIAPPGYGKTRVSAQLAATAARRGQLVAWVTVDDLDNDPAILLTYLAAAFEPLLAPVASHRGRLSGLVTPVAGRAVARLAARLQALGSPTLLVLDDVHRLVDQIALDVVTGLIDRLPPGLSVALAGRTRPHMPFARFRAQGHLFDVRPEDLAFDEHEAAGLVRAAGFDLTSAEVQRLVRRTEGWPAAVTLGIQAALDDGGRPETLVDLSGSHSYVADYLHSEFARGLTEEDMAVLTRTAVVDPVRRDVADVVAGPGSGERIWRLSSDHGLIRRQSPAEQEVRYHPLLKEFLVDELERREAGATPALHRAAAAWYARTGHHARAVEESIASGDPRLAGAAVTAGAPEATAETMDGWLNALDPSAFRQYPPVAVAAAWRHLLGGRPEAAEQLADLADHADFDEPPPDGSSSFESQRARLRAVMGREGPRAVLADALLAAAAEPRRSRWHATAVWLLGEAYVLLGDAAAADAALREAASAPSPDGLASTLALAALAGLRIDEGQWSAADALVAEGRAHATEWSGSAPAPMLRVFSVDARVAVALGDAGRARDDLALAGPLVPLANRADPWLSVDALLHLGQAYLSMSEPADAQDALRRAEQIVRVRPHLGTLRTKLAGLRDRVEEASSTLVGSSALTPAELRVIPYLPTHLSFQDIADRLTISRNTVKTHAMSIYSKLWASSRDEAVRRAVELGLLPPNPVLHAAEDVAVDLPPLDDVDDQWAAPPKRWRRIVIDRPVEIVRH